LTLPTPAVITTNATGAAKRTYHTGVHYEGDSVCVCECVDKPRRVQEEYGGNNIDAHPVAHIITITNNRLARSTPKYTYYIIILYTPRRSTYLVHNRYDTRAQYGQQLHTAMVHLFPKRDSSQSLYDERD